MSKVLHALHQGAGFVLQWLLRLLILLAFRPKRAFVSEKAREAVKSGPYVVISNHVRGMDAAVIFTLLPRAKITGLVAKDMLDNSPALRTFIGFLPCVPIDREHASLSWMRESRRLLKQGRSIYLCPEGRCNRAKVIRPFKPGFVALAASAGVQVIPIYHNGVYHYVFGRRFRMLVGEPVTLTPPPEGLSQEEMERESAQLHDIMTDLERKLNGFVRTEPAEEEPSA